MEEMQAPFIPVGSALTHGKVWSLDRLDHMDGTDD